MSKKQIESIESRLAGLNEHELRRQLVQYMTTQRLGLVWERDVIARDAAITADVVLPEFIEELSCRGAAKPGDPYRNLIIEGDNFDSLRLLKTTHANKIRVIYIDPPYNTGNKDWVYNDSFVGKNDRWRHSQWLEFLYQRLELARDLLKPDGVILVSINDDNRDRLGVLMDEVFPGMRVGSFVWKTRSGSNDESGALFSVDHEHVLIYGNPAFKFQGELKDFSLYKNPDGDTRGRWKTGDLSKAHTYLERPNTYYPIQDPTTGVWYPCNPSMVWRFSSELKIEDETKLRAKTMEQYIREGKVIFPNPITDRVMTWATKSELLEAIRVGDVPVRPKTKTPLISESIPDLDFWIGKPVGFGRPWFKRHLVDVQSDIRPVSSWIRGSTDPEASDEMLVELMAQRSGTGEHSVNEIMGFNAFTFPKPPSLLKALLQQATTPNDIVLDFFAGSGTTAHALLALNAEDGGSRKFIMCSSTEATKREPSKNLCRDVCAARVNKAITGYGKTEALGGDFAYLQLSKIPPEDARMDFTPEQAFNLLNLRSALSIKAYPKGPVRVIHSNDELAIVYLPEVNAAAIEALIALPQSRLAVYSARPQTVAEKLEASGKEGNSYAIGDAILSGQAGNMASTLGAAE